MAFSSFVFLAAFLPLTLAVYYFAQPRFRNAVLLFASFIFYLWGDVRYFGVLIAMVGVSFLGGLALERLQSGRKTALRLLVGGLVVLELATLCVFKYAHSFGFVNVTLPLGISFYVFQTVAYLVDVYRGTVKASRNPIDFALYSAFFPRILSGPIIKYSNLAPQLAMRSVTAADFQAGIRRFLVGFSKKLLFANNLGLIADRVFAETPGTFGTCVAWIGAIAYTLQLYFDFSGYTDMAIGIGRLFGFRLPENFDYPYLSSSITEFWRRWHITLGAWFRDYLYIPLGGNRVSKFRNYLNLSIVFLATGVWHGAAWTFVVWGAWHGAFILLEKATKLKSHVYAMLVVILGWVLFRSDSFGYAFRFMADMLGLLPTTPTHTLDYFIGSFDFLVMGLSIPVALGWCRRMTHDIWLLALFVVSCVFLAGSNFNPFIYFKF